MKRANIYIGALVIIMIIAQFMQMLIGTSVLSSWSLPIPEFFMVLKGKKELIADLSNRSENTIQQDTFLMLMDDIYLLTNKKEQKITWLQGIDGESLGMDSLLFYEIDLPLAPYEKLSLRNMERLNYLQDSIKETYPREIILSQEDLFNRIVRADKVQALVSQRAVLNEFDLAGKFFFSPFFGPFLLIIMTLLIWCINKSSQFIAGILQRPKWQIIGTVYSLFILWTTWQLTQIHYTDLLAKQLDWPIWLTGQILVSLLFIPGFFLFLYLKGAYFDKLDFADREAAKFGYIFILWSIFNLLHSYLGSQIFDYLNQDAYAYSVWLTPQIPAFALMLATGNFLNNFQKRYYQLKNKEKIIETVKKKELKSELAALQSRVNPHFLYNALNSIASLAQEDAVKTEKMALALSKFYKYSTNRKEEHWTTIAEEIDLLNAYLEIEQIRFGEQLIIDYELDPSLKKEQIPRFLLQPLVENAIKYGYNEEAKKTMVKVIIGRLNGHLQIKIMDNGSPFSEKMELGYGLRSVQKKLKLLFPKKHQLDFVNEPEKGVLITLELEVV